MAPPDPFRASSLLLNLLIPTSFKLRRETSAWARILRSFHCTFIRTALPRHLDKVLQLDCSLTRKAHPTQSYPLPSKDLLAHPTGIKLVFKGSRLVLTESASWGITRPTVEV